VIEGAINRAAFNTYVETQLAPTLARGDVVVLDNLSVHKSAKAKAACAGAAPGSSTYPARRPKSSAP
jgi:hypothetical protein